MQALFEQLEAIHPALPLFVRAILVVGAALLLWIIISVPAHWLTLAISPPLFRLLATLSRARASALAVAGRLFETRRLPVEQFVSNHAQVFALARENDGLVRALGGVQKTISSWTARGGALEKRLVDVERGTKESKLAIQRIEWPEAIDAPTPQQYSLIRAERNDAWLRMIVFTIFSAFLIAINTLMLREFFASIMPPVRFYGIPISIIFSFLFSVLELIFGFCLALVERPSLSISGFLRLVLLLALVLLALIEFGFYAQFGAELDFNPFATLWAPDRPPPWTKLWLGLFGPLVVMGLGYSGHGLAAALRVLCRDNVVRQYRGFLNLITRKADELERRTGAARRISDDLTDTLKNLEPRYKALADDVPGAVKQLEQVRTELQNITAHAQSIRQNPFASIGPSEMLRSYLSCIFVAPTVPIAFMLIALAFGAMGFSEPINIGRAALPGFGVAVAETTLAIGIGYATGRIAMRMSGHDAAVSLGFIAASIFAYTAIAALIIANAIAFFHRGTWVDFMWFAFTCAANLWLFVIGRGLGLVVAAVWALLQASAVLIASLLLLAVAGLLLVLTSIVYLALTLTHVVAFPFRILFGRKEGEQAFAAGTMALLVALVLTGPGRVETATAQQPSLEPQSSVSVLVDLSATWHNPASEPQNSRILKAVADAVTTIAANTDPPISVWYIVIGDLSLGREPLCRVNFTPKLLQNGHNPNELSSLRRLREYLAEACVRSILGRRQEKFTDLSAALDSAYRYTEHQPGPFKCFIVLSDFKEERRRSQAVSKLRLAGVKAVLVYRVLDEDRHDPSKLDKRIDGWRSAMNAAGAEVVALSDVGASGGQISRMCGQ